MTVGMSMDGIIANSKSDVQPCIQCKAVNVCLHMRTIKPVGRHFILNLPMSDTLAKLGSFSANEPVEIFGVRWILIAFAALGHLGNQIIAFVVLTIKKTSTSTTEQRFSSVQAQPSSIKEEVDQDKNYVESTKKLDQEKDKKDNPFGQQVKKTYRVEVDNIRRSRWKDEHQTLYAV
ncbi:hypothetical protein GCK72_008672 [Caenorhabditis remanei]|uniref:Uncharacterized protein n=1 Tax=Caenorhabditis remanei TaxID=31234 RepID=A0A6A5H1B0_CAERE|nr:hypothetical protein GCK72_008672 [Caenorhabditis remanei]KAF1760423.1 hypothetical protein GCK72_008672 [Caenorhabditis remanei]